MVCRVSAVAIPSTFVQSVASSLFRSVFSMPNALLSREKRVLWIFTVSALVFALFVLFGRLVSQLGLDFLVYYEPSSVLIDRRLPLSDRDNPEYAIRTVGTFKEVESKQSTALMIHGDARESVNFDFLKSEFARGTIIIAVNMLPAELDGLVAEGIQDVADVDGPLGHTFFTMLGKTEGHCREGLQRGCGVFIVTARNFSGFEDMNNLARDSLDRVLRGRLTPTAT